MKTLELKQLSPGRLGAAIVEIAGFQSETALSTISELHKLVGTGNGGQLRPWFKLWQSHCSQALDLSEADELLKSEISILNDEPGMGLFLTQSYCVALICRFLYHASDVQCKALKSTHMLAWFERAPSDIMERINDVCDAAVIEAVGPNVTVEPIAFYDAVSVIFQELFPAPLRHLSGEYYTPSWLVELSIDLLDFSAIPRSPVALDPAVGSGAFLVHWLERLAKTGATGSSYVRGFDTNPLATALTEIVVNFAQAQYAEQGLIVHHSISITDSILDPIAPEAGTLFTPGGHSLSLLGQTFSVTDPDLENRCRQLAEKEGLSGRHASAFGNTVAQYVTGMFSSLERGFADIILGNPPWITWDGLDTAYRKNLGTQWQGTPLAAHRGWRAKVAAGKTDISSLFVYRSATRFASQNATMAFVLPLSLLQSRHASSGFRKFRSTKGQCYAPTIVHDFSKVKVFGDAVNRTCVAAFRVGLEASYPIEFVEWSEKGPTVLRGDVSQARPISSSDLSSPIVQYSPDDEQLLGAVGQSDYRARGGVNTGGGNTILWVNKLEVNNEELLVSNIGKTRNSASQVKEDWVESGAVSPLLGGKGMKRWSPEPKNNLLLLYSADNPKKALLESEAQERFPKAFKFLSAFREQLTSRKEYHRWGGNGPFYEVYRIGPYTFSPIKVVWQHTGFKDRLKIAVLDNRESKLVIPDQKIIMISVSELDEAHYICAFLGSTPIGKLLGKYLGIDASTHILDFAGLRKFNKNDLTHMKLSKLSARAHVLTNQGEDVAAIEREIDDTVLDLIALKSQCV